MNDFENLFTWKENIMKATFFQQLGEHEKALSMLVHQLKDFAAAEQYCIAQSKGASNTTKSNIFLILLKIYLRPPPG